MSLRSLLSVLSCAAALSPVASPRASDVPPAAGGPPAAAAPASVPAGARPAAAPGSAADLLERAWTIAQRTRVERARIDALDARALAADAAFPAPPVLGLDLRRDLPRGVALPGTDAAPERGRSELEPGIALPLWLPGQREAVRRVVDRERGLRDAAARAARLELAGEVREAAWALAIAAGELRVQRVREASAAALEDDVARRVAAGELAPVDRMNARGERLAAAAAVLEAEARERAAAARLRTIAGTDAIGALLESPEASAPDAGAHPALAAADEAVRTARARLEAAQRTRRDAPTLSAVARFERDAYGTDWRNTVRVGIAVPLDTEARNAPRIAAAGVELAEAEVALERERRERAGEAERARIALQAAREALALQAERAAVAADALAAHERAFRAGERGLPELLRLRAIGTDASLARELARERLGLAIARLNQALGAEP